ncbi:RHS repeat-associated core domain-containing protein [Vibrio artabrorum]|uniref:RHS repeat-associated core domain-containing protein n=1 Tax=Vibrio artabrorum TaxID=446374 RepID=UPI003552E56D
MSIDFKVIENYSRRTFIKRLSLAIGFSLMSNAFSGIPYALASGDNSVFYQSNRRYFKGYMHYRNLDKYMLPNGRPYDPKLGCFLSPDSFSPFGPAGFNRYQHCNLDPINQSDPSGHLSWQSGLGITLGVFAVLITLGAGIPYVLGASTLIGAIAAMSSVTFGLVSAATGIASVVYSESDPTLAKNLGYASLAFGSASFVTGVGIFRAAKASQFTHISRSSTSLYAASAISSITGSVFSIVGEEYNIKALSYIGDALGVIGVGTGLMSMKVNKFSSGLRGLAQENLTEVQYTSGYRHASAQLTTTPAWAQTYV